MAHGKKSQVWIETTPGAATKPPVTAGTGYTKITKASQFTLALAKDLSDASVMDSEDKLSEAGQKGGTFTSSFRYKQSEYAIMFAAWQSDTPVSVISRPEGSVVGKYQHYADYHVQDLQVTGSNADVVNGTITLQRTGASSYAAIADS